MRIYRPYQKCPVQGVGQGIPEREVDVVPDEFGGVLVLRSFQINVDFLFLVLCLVLH